MNMKRNILFACILTVIMVPLAVLGVTWPATGITTANTITMASPYEPSGLAWNEVTNKLFAVSDPTSDGQNRITMMDADGSNQVTWKSSGDFEALSIVNPYSNFIYVGVENAPAIKEFDITSVRTEPAGFELKVFCKFLNCKIKNMFVTDFFIPSAMKGNYLSGFRNSLTKHELLDQRNLYGNGGEIPLRHSVIQLNSKRSEEFLTQGTQFYKADSGERFVFQIEPDWGGYGINIYTTDKNIELNKSFAMDAIQWVKENNLLKGEKFSIMGEFLDKKEIGWDDVIFPDEEAKNKVKGSIDRLTKTSPSRGIMLIGPPGTGKTMTGKVLMNQPDTTFIWASSKDFRYGAAGALALGFEMARDLAPSVFFLEDIAEKHKIGQVNFYCRGNQNFGGQTSP